MAFFTFIFRFGMRREGGDIAYVVTNGMRKPYSGHLTVTDTEALNR